MKTNIFTLLIGLAILFAVPTMAQTNNKTENKTSLVGPPPTEPTASCLDVYLTNAQGIWDLMNVGLLACKTANDMEPNVDQWIECNQIVTDSYLAMHSVIDAAYDRCRGVNN